MIIGRVLSLPVRFCNPSRQTFYTFHVLNAFEEDDGKLIKIISCDYYDLKFDLVSGDLANNPGKRRRAICVHLVLCEARRRPARLARVYPTEVPVAT